MELALDEPGCHSGLEDKPMSLLQRQDGTFRSGSALVACIAGLFLAITPLVGSIALLTEGLPGPALRTFMSGVLYFCIGFIAIFSMLKLLSWVNSPRKLS
ncbi:hypothetical protein [Bosea sp. ANAM02]|uniref:hypothetical protein n=1 Tax=Bosea sp. ANAM02 TaxID=2020412 RepID=UPI00140F4C76|nr:hypothetical protein [Bosea sp. ANAM02]BCB22464.1 hypothetical protein OCUBac02_53580 [Bosea sp. ANAM02]